MSKAERRKKQANMQALATIEFRIADARIALEEQRHRRQQLHDELVEARKEEEREWKILLLKRAAKQKRRQEKVVKMQKQVRGWLVRRRFILSINKQTTEHINWAALLPKQLDLQLSQLQHLLHKIKYAPEDVIQATVRLQSWWRGVMARRMVVIIKLRLQIMAVLSRMEKAAVKMQARFRGRLAKNTWYGKICMAMAQKSITMQRAMHHGLKCVIKIQRNARRMIQQRLHEERRLKFLELEAKGLNMKLEETSRLMGVCDPRDLSRQLGPPRRDHALQELEEEGLTPFYLRASNHPAVARHRIGGATALEMQQRIAAAAADSGAADNQGDTNAEVADLMETLPNVYLSGFSPDFVEGLDDDVWPRDPWIRARAPPENLAKDAPKRRREKGKARKISQRRICMAPHSHTEQRAQRVRLGREVKADLVSQQEEPEPAHPLLVNAPALPPPPGRPSPAAHLRHVDTLSRTECSWPAATRLRPLPTQRTLPVCSL